VIDLRGEQVIEHVHGGCEQHTLIGLTSTPRQDFREEGFPNTGIANDDNAGAVADKVEIHKAKDAILHLHTTLVVIELETVDGMTDAQMGEAKATLNGTSIPGFELAIDERFQSGRQAEILSGSFTQELIQVPAHRRQCQVIEFLLERVHRTPFENRE